MEYTEAYMRSIDEALADEKFADKLSSVETKEQIQKIFLNEKGIEIDDAVAQLAIEKADYIRSGGELTEEDLEIVAGGCWDCIVNASYAMGGGFVTGALVGAAAGGPLAPFTGIVGGGIGLVIGGGAAVVRSRWKHRR